MKSVKLISEIIVLLVILSSTPAYSINQGETKESFESSYKLSPDGKLTFNVYSCDLKVNVWKNSEVKLAGEIIYSGGEAEDRNLLVKAFKSPEVKTGTNSLEINTEFWENMSSSGLSTKITLKGGEKIKIAKFKSSYTLWIPERIAFALNSKYNNVEIADFPGTLDCDLYDADILAGNFGDNSVFNAKYSTLVLGSGAKTTFNIYDCKINGQNFKNVEIDSKYSTLKFVSLNFLKAGSYDDKFEIKNLTAINVKASYSSFIIGGQMGNSSLDLYDTDVKGGSYESLTYTAKYSELTADKVTNLNVSTIYNCVFNIDQVEDFTCNDSKYDKITLGLAVNSIKMPNTYDTQFIVNKVSKTFASFTGDFKYGSVSISTDPELNYKLVFENTYGNISYPKERFSIMPLRDIEKNGRTQFEGSTDQDAKCDINFTGYDLNFTIK